MLFEQLFHNVPWRQRSVIIKGESYLMPRLTAWFGDQPYSYSGVTHEVNLKVTSAYNSFVLVWFDFYVFGFGFFFGFFCFVLFGWLVGWLVCSTEGHSDVLVDE